MQENLGKQERRERMAKERMQQMQKKYVDELRWVWGRKLCAAGPPSSCTGVGGVGKGKVEKVNSAKQ